MPSAARPRRSGKPKVVYPSPPNVVPMRVKRASFSEIGSRWPWQSAQPTGAKLNPTAMIWPTYGWLICASPSRRRSVANRSPSRRSRRRPPPSREPEPREAEEHQRPGRRLGGRRRAFGRNVEDKGAVDRRKIARQIHKDRGGVEGEGHRQEIGGAARVHGDACDWESARESESETVEDVGAGQTRRAEWQRGVVDD